MSVLDSTRRPRHDVVILDFDSVFLDSAHNASKGGLRRGTPALLRALHENGTYVIALTAEPAFPFADTIASYGMGKYVDAACTDFYRQGLEDKRNIIRSFLPEDAGLLRIVGDKADEMACALALGAEWIGFPSEASNAAELIRHGVRVALEGMPQLTEFLLDGGKVADGMFLSFEGSDGCGKSTQVRLLADRLGKWGMR